MSSNISNVNDPPPDYFDISIVPNAAVLFHDASLETNGISQAKIERNRKGVISFDSLIDRNPDQLWLYFMTYLSEKLTFHITIYGYYTEVRKSIDFARMLKCLPIFRITPRVIQRQMPMEQLEHTKKITHVM